MDRTSTGENAHCSTSSYRTKFQLNKDEILQKKPFCRADERSGSRSPRMEDRISLR